jgi:ribosome biogenesis protein NSA2
VVCVVCAAKSWKRMVTKVCFVGDSFTRKAPKYERFIRPTGLRFKRAHVTHPELQVIGWNDKAR